VGGSRTPNSRERDCECGNWSSRESSRDSNRRKNRQLAFSIGTSKTTQANLCEGDDGSRVVWSFVCINKRSTSHSAHTHKMQITTARLQHTAFPALQKYRKFIYDFRLFSRRAVTDTRYMLKSGYSTTKRPRLKDADNDCMVRKMKPQEHFYTLQLYPTAILQPFTEAVRVD
jgi:hypothetical protein